MQDTTGARPLVKDSYTLREAADALGGSISLAAIRKRAARPDHPAGLTDEALNAAENIAVVVGVVAVLARRAVDIDRHG